MIIKPVSDLRNYEDVLKDVIEKEPVFLTCDGYEKYVISSIQEYNKNKAKLELMMELLKGERSAREEGFVSLEEVKKHLEERVIK